MRFIASAMGIGTGGIKKLGTEDMLERMTMDSKEEEEEHMGPLHDAASMGKMDTCKHLVENLGFDVDVDASDGSDMGPLACAVSHGKVIAVRYFLDKGADPNKQDVTGFASLHYAAKQGYDRIACLLLSRGASVDVYSSEGTPLHVAASHGKSGVMEILLKHHADLDKVSPDLYTPVAETLCAAYEKMGEFACLKCRKLLVKAGANLNSTNPDTPLVIATSKGLTECVNYLLEVGADANIPIKNDKESDEDRDIQLNLHAEKAVKEDAGTSRAYTENKLSDEDRKAQLKLHGGKAVAEMDYAGASKFFREAIMLDPADATLYSNRSLCHLKIGKVRDALLDANTCITLQPEWQKGYYR